MTAPTQIFNRRALRIKRDRAARSSHDDFLFVEIAERLAERLLDIRRDFPRVLALDARGGIIRQLTSGRVGQQKFISTDLGFEFSRQQSASGPAVQVDAEALPFGEDSFDLVLAPSGLHWINDLPGSLIQIQRCLSPDGLFLGAMIGGSTLGPLNAALVNAEVALRGGANLRLSPRLELVDAAALLQRAGFALPVADKELITVEHSSALKLLYDLRGMAETNSLNGRETGIPPRALFPTALGDLHSDPSEPLITGFEVLFLAGWRPDAQKQQQPLKPGSAKASLADFLT